MTIDIENYSSPNYNSRRGERPQMLVMHYTACPINEALQILTSRDSQVSAHYLVPQEGNRVHKLVEEGERAWHAGKGGWKSFDDVNSVSVGIENEGWGYTYGWVPPKPANGMMRYLWSCGVHLERKLGEGLDQTPLCPLKRHWHLFPEGQIEILSILSRRIIERWHIDPENVVGHSDIAPDRKVDPGPRFPWKALAAKGIGIWYPKSVDRLHSYKPQGKSVSWMQKALQEWGYHIPLNGMLDEGTQKVTAAFQMHFRPEIHDGKIDSESMDVLDRLLCQRRNRLDQ